jgi:hypothetical protein
MRLLQTALIVGLLAAAAPVPVLADGCPAGTQTSNSNWCRTDQGVVHRTVGRGELRQSPNLNWAYTPDGFPVHQHRWIRPSTAGSDWGVTDDNHMVFQPSGLRPSTAAGYCVTSQNYMVRC